MISKEVITRGEQGLFSGAPEHAALVNRDICERFSNKEKGMLALELKWAWENSFFDSKNAEIIHLRNGNFEWGHYRDNEAYALADEENEIKKDMLSGESAYALVNLEDDRDVLAMRTALEYLGVSESVVGSLYFPYTRGDRPELRDDGKRELLLLKTLVKDIASAGVKKISLIDVHSPAFSWFCLNEGIAVLDLSALPLLVDEALNRGIIRDDLPTIGVCGDDGALEMGRYVVDKLGAEDMIVGDKKKIEIIDEKTGKRKIKTVVDFSEEDLEKVFGKQVVIGEDIISSGGTLEANIEKLLVAGARSIVVLATHGIFAGDAVSKLANNPLVKIITTDGRTSQKDISEKKNIIQIPVMNKMKQVLKLDKENVDFWSKEGVEKLLELGFCISPWQIYNLPSFET